MWHELLPLLPLLTQHRCITFNQPGAGAGNPAAYDPVSHATLQGYAATPAAGQNGGPPAATLTRLMPRAAVTARRSCRLYCQQTAAS